MIVKMSMNFLDGGYDGDDEDLNNTIDDINNGENNLGDGIFISKKPPIVINVSKEEFELDTEKDYFSYPYETNTIFVWKGEKPRKLEDDEYKGQGNYGCALSFMMSEPSCITICFEND